MKNNELSFFLRAAIAQRATCEIYELLQRHGLVAFAQALAPWSARAIADVLSLLPPATRTAVWLHLPAANGRALRAAGLAPCHTPQAAAHPPCDVAPTGAPWASSPLLNPARDRPVVARRPAAPPPEHRLARPTLCH